MKVEVNAIESDVMAVAASVLHQKKGPQHGHRLSAFVLINLVISC